MKFRNAARGVRTIFMAEKFELTTALIMAAMVIAVQFARVTETYGYSAETDALRIESIGLMMIGGVIAIIGFAFAVQGTQDASRNEPVFRNTLPWLIVGIVGIMDRGGGTRGISRAEQGHPRPAQDPGHRRRLCAADAEHEYLRRNHPRGK